MISNCEREASEGVFCKELQIGNASWFPDLKAKVDSVSRVCVVRTMEKIVF